MKIIVGLGNPGREYVQTRHNIGFLITDAFVRTLDAVSERTRFRAILREGARNGEKFIVAQPQMYMNLSGIPVREILNWYKANISDLLVVYDDMDLSLGQLRLRADGSAGGHNGMKSIIGELGSQQVARLRVGIGRGGGASHAHVLSRFTAEEASVIDHAVGEAVSAVALWADRGIMEAMNAVNKPAVVTEPD